MKKKLFIILLLAAFIFTTTIGYQKYAYSLNQTSEVYNQLSKDFNNSIEEDRKDNFGVSVNDIEAFPNGLVSFVDDDGFNTVWTKLLPIFEKKQTPCVVAIPSNFVNIENHLNSNDLLYLQKIGWEIASYGANHIKLTELNNDEIESELKDSKDALTKIGLDCNYIVYPYGSVNSNVSKLTKKYYDAGINVSVGFNKYPLDRYTICTMPLGSYFSSDKDSNTLDYYKDKIDEAKKTNSWLIFMMHSYETTDTQLSYISNVIDYCKENKIKIVTLEDGFKQADDFAK